MADKKARNARVGQAELDEKLATLDNWEILNGKLHKEFRFASFGDAISFVMEVAEIAETLDHHPEIFNAYNKVVLELSTHDAGGLTLLDFEFARTVDLLPPKAKASSPPG